MTKDKKPREVGIGHNLGNEEIRLENQNFFVGLADLKRLTRESAGLAGESGQVYKRLKNAGWSKKDMKFAMSLDDQSSIEIVEDMKKKFRIIELMGYGIADQMSFLNDLASDKEAAYMKGFNAGALRQDMKANPYPPGSEDFNDHQSGFNDGTELVNKQLDEAVNGTEEEEAEDEE